MREHDIIVKRLKHRMLDIAYKNQVGYLGFGRTGGTEEIGTFLEE